MRILGIETSCDETAVALVRDGSLEDSALSSQSELHSIFGGVVPELASREHYRFIGPLYDQLLERNGLCGTDLDAIAVTRGPGLLGSILVGMGFAKALAFTLDIPLLGINHLHAHLLAAGLERPLVYPALGLLVSGGHTHIYRIESPWAFEILGHTLDDAAGEAFDKTGHFLGLPYPAGKSIDAHGKLGTADSTLLPRPYLENDNLNFSFSGLKTHAVQYIRKMNPASDNKKLNDFCASFNQAVADTLAIKLERALNAYPVSAIWMAGGVAANSCIRHKISTIAKTRGLELIMPSPALCTDNAAMIAYTGFLLANAGFYHSLDIEAIPRGRKIPMDMHNIHSAS